MEYFSNMDVARQYGISEATVRRWISLTRAGEIDLQLREHNGKAHISNTIKNKRILQTLAAKSRKEAGARWHRKITPKPEFYSAYSQEQIIDIIASVDVQRVLPLQYDYIGLGASAWDVYAKRLWEEENSTLSATVEMLDSCMGRIDRLVEDYEQVNVIDLGVGNALPVKELLTHLVHERPMLGRYIAIDISEEMLEIARRNIKQWFDGQVPFEGYVRDLSYQRFHDLLGQEQKGNSLNLVLFLGGTINNFQAPGEVLRTIYHSMGRNDLLVTTRKLDSVAARRSFDFSADPDLPHPRHTRVLLNLLNIDESLYDLEQLYDDNRHLRLVRAILKTDLTIDFEVESGNRSVTVRKGEGLVVWLARHQSVSQATKQLEDNGFSLLDASLTRDQNFLLTISKVSDSQLFM